jgi:hypothetical protein
MSFSLTPVNNIHLDKYHEQTQCSICLEDYEVTDAVVATKCNHLFHQACIGQYELQGQNKNCPICRTALSPSYSERMLDRITQIFHGQQVLSNLIKLPLDTVATGISLLTPLATNAATTLTARREEGEEPTAAEQTNAFREGAFG